MNDVCNFCGNKTFREASVTYTYRRGDRMLVVNNVPCEKCEYCGEQYYDGDVIFRIEREFKAIYSEGRVPQRTISVPLEEFSGLAA